MRRALCCLVLALAIAAVAAAQENVLYLPAAASTPGLNETFFLTDAVLFNPDPEQAVTVFLSWLPGGSDNSAASEVQVTVPPRRGVRLEDLVGQTLAAGGAGGVRMRGSGPFLAVSRTFNAGDAAVGTFGQTILGVPESAALQQGLLLGLVNDPTPTGFRANVGFLNPGLATTTVTVKVWDANAAVLLGEATVTLPPRGFSQSNAFSLIGRAATPAANATVEFTADGPVFGYLSLVENQSGDAVFVLAVADDGTPASSSNQPPQGTITSPSGDPTVEVSEPVAFAASVSDPDGDAVTGAEWDFGDQTTASGLEVSHAYDAPGVYTVRFTATDSNGASDPTQDTRTVTVEAANSPPNGTITVPAGNVTIQVGGTVSFEASVSDPDGDQVTGSWDFGDDVSAGGLAVNHTYGSAGTFTVSFTATDSNGAADPTPDTRTVTVEPAEPGTYSQVQAQIFNASCALSGCHTGSSPPRGMNLSAGQAYSNIVNIPSVQNPDLDRIEPGDPSASLMWLKVNGQAGSRMPLGGPPLDAARLELLRSWIAAGALNN